MNRHGVFLILLSIFTIFLSCDDDSGINNEGNCADFEANLTVQIPPDVTIQYEENSQFVAAFHTVLKTDPTDKSNAIQITWKTESTGLGNSFAVLAKDDIWEVGSYNYTQLGTDNSFIIASSTSQGSQFAAETATITIDDVTVGSERDGGTVTQNDYLYLKGSFTGQFKKVNLEVVTVTGQFEICN